jgi:DUF1680 family protein
MISRRRFVQSAVAAPLLAGSTAAAQDVPEAGLTQVRLTEGPFLEAQEANHKVLSKLPVDRLVHNFRINAGLASTAQPLGGWEKPDCELRGHFTGHYLSAVALMYASTGDEALKEKAGAITAELARCQQALGGGYLSAFPLEYWDRLKARQKVWAPFYTLHKVMAGLLDVHQLCGNAQALEVLKGTADWVDRWSAPIPHAQMQDILNTENGGMNEVLYNLAAVAGERRYIAVAHRFDHEKFLDPLAARRDELTGLHANTNMPKVIGAARRYELTGETRYRDMAQFFWEDVTSARTYCTGGTSNDEHWLTGAFALAEELEKSEDTNECCVAYNMLKLTRHLYEWNPDPRYFDYYEQTLYNHRLGTIDPATGATMYFLPLRPGGWKIFNSEYDSFWCCTGTGVEEYSKLGGAIYFHDDRGVYVNLFIPSRLDWKERGVRIEQTTRFPEEGKTALTVRTPKPAEFELRVRIPSWAKQGGYATINGRRLDTFAGPSSYLTIARVWKDNDRLELNLPMKLWSLPLAGNENMAAVLYGPLVLAADLGLPEDSNRYPADQEIKQPLLPAPVAPGDLRDPSSWLEATSPLHFRAKSVGITLTPLYQVLDQRYALYWKSNA